MKTKKKIINEPSLIDELRLIRDNLSLEMKDLSILEIKELLAKKETLHPPSVWQKQV